MGNDTAGALVHGFFGGEKFDLAIFLTGIVDALAAKGQIMLASKRVLATTGVGIAEASGRKPPNIATIDVLWRILLDANSIVCTDPAMGGSSGIFMAKLLQRFSIFEQLKSKTALVGAWSILWPPERLDLAFNRSARYCLQGTSYLSVRYPKNSGIIPPMRRRPLPPLPSRHLPETSSHRCRLRPVWQ